MKPEDKAFAEQVALRIKENGIEDLPYLAMFQCIQYGWIEVEAQERRFVPVLTETGKIAIGMVEAIEVEERIALIYARIGDG
jgi:hypothetical protein